MFGTSSTPEFYFLLDGAIPALSIVIGTAVVHRFTKVRDARRIDAARLSERVEILEENVTDIKEGLFGKLTPFGKSPGFVDEVRRALDHLVADTRTNGGLSSKDDLQAIRRAIEGKDDA